MWWWFGIGGLLYVILLFARDHDAQERPRLDVLLRDLLPAPVAHRRVHATAEKRVRLTPRALKDLDVSRLDDAPAVGWS